MKWIGGPNFFFSILLTPLQVTFECPSGGFRDYRTINTIDCSNWFDSPSGDTEFIYVFQATYKDAYWNCHDMNGYLAVLDTREEHEKLRECKQSGYIGLKSTTARDVVQTSFWSFLARNPSYPISSDGWWSGVGTGRRESVAVIGDESTDYCFYDVVSDPRRGYYCERPKSTCPVGHYRPGKADRCYPCPVNTYKDWTGDWSTDLGPCKPCPEDTGTDGAQGATKCGCNKDGFHDDPVIGCKDINECALPNSPCDANAQCSNTVGSFTCSCEPGFNGDGLTCSDINECSVQQTSPCDVNAHCLNNDGSFTCNCNRGYLGEGFKCFEAEICEVVQLYRLAETNHGMSDEYVDQSFDKIPSAVECSRLCDHLPNKCWAIDYSKPNQLCHLLTANSHQIPNKIVQKPGFKHYHKNINT